MKILVFGGTRLMGKYLVRELIEKGHDVTIATRGIAKDDFGCQVKRITVDRYNEESIKQNIPKEHFDIVYDNLAFGSLDVIKLIPHLNTDRIISISSTAVCQKHINTTENDFDPYKHEFILCERKDLPYGEVKRQAEVALFCKYSHIPSTAVRFPFAVSADDHTKRLRFYIEHTINSVPMFIDNIDKQMSFVHSMEAGKFLAYLCGCDFTGIVNGASNGTVSLREIISYAEQKTGKKAILSTEGDAAPYNSEPEYSINTEKARALGFHFSDVHDWMFRLVDEIIADLIR